MSEEEQWTIARQHPNIVKLNSDLAALKTSCGHVAAENLEISDEAVKAKADYEETLKYFLAIKASYGENLAASQRAHKVAFSQTVEFYRQFVDKAVKEAQLACSRTEEGVLSAGGIKDFIEKRKRLRMLQNVGKILKS